MPSEPRFAVFDLDGTLIDSAASIVAGVVACWSALGYPNPDPQAVKRIIGLPWDKAVGTLLPGSGEHELGQIRRYHDEVARGVRTRPPVSEALFPGAVETLVRLEAEGYVLGIVTSRTNRRLAELLDQHGIGRRFATVKTVDHGPGKPDPYLLLQAMSDVGIDRLQTVMIGDTTFDIEMAGNAGTASVGVAWGVHTIEALRAAGANHVVDAFVDLPPIIGALTGRGR